MARVGGAFQLFFSIAFQSIPCMEPSHSSHPIQPYSANPVHKPTQIIRAPLATSPCHVCCPCRVLLYRSSKAKPALPPSYLVFGFPVNKMKLRQIDVGDEVSREEEARRGVWRLSDGVSSPSCIRTPERKERSRAPASIPNSGFLLHCPP